ncbi:MAG: DUF2442 domain-containing protein [Bacteroidia bacterium]|nr:DUF2442 domain-containing protein [Bacteroidia bacterium]
MKPMLLSLRFHDGAEKTVDIQSLVKKTPLTAPLSDPVFFAQVRLYEDQRGIYWPNDFDLCADFLRAYAPGKIHTAAT